VFNASGELAVEQLCHILPSASFAGGHARERRGERGIGRRVLARAMQRVACQLRTPRSIPAARPRRGDRRRFASRTDQEPNSLSRHPVVCGVRYSRAVEQGYCPSACLDHRGRLARRVGRIFVLSPVTDPAYARGARAGAGARTPDSPGQILPLHVRHSADRVVCGLARVRRLLGPRRPEGRDSQSKGDQGSKSHGFND
jgi:hypothetical protein